MLKILLISSIFLSVVANAENPAKPDPSSPINAVEQIHGLPGGSSGAPYIVKKGKKKKRRIKVYSNVVTPIENTTPANCADNINGKGDANYTACQAGQK